MNDRVIQVEGLSKRYQLGTIGYGSLQHDLKAWWARTRGKEDPNSKIGEKDRHNLHTDFWAVKDLGFEVCKGDRIGIVGRNGAGKSTLLKLLSRVTSPTAGSIKVRGRVSSLLEVGTGFHPELTGRENVFLNGAILGMKRREIQAKFNEIVDFAEVGSFIDTPVKRYSSGMYVRLAFSVAAHLESEILIIDEVLAVGDAEFQRKCIGKMDDVSKGQGRTILFVSHQIGPIKALCNKGIFLDQGRIVHQGPILTTLDRYYAHNKKSIAGWVKGRSLDSLPGIQIEDMVLRDGNGNQVEAGIDNQEALSLLIALRVTEFQENLTIGFSLFSGTNECVYRSLTTDLDARWNKRLSPGLHLLTCEIPIYFLRAGTYSVNLDASIHNREWIIKPDEDKEYELRFDLFNTQFSTIHTTSGFIAPPIAWSIRNQDDFSGETL